MDAVAASGRGDGRGMRRKDIKRLRKIVVDTADASLVAIIVGEICENHGGGIDGEDSYRELAKTIGPTTLRVINETVAATMKMVQYLIDREWMLETADADAVVSSIVKTVSHSLSNNLVIEGVDELVRSVRNED